MTQDNDGELRKEVTFSASKQLWGNLGKEITVRGAICEFIDNSIDSHQRHTFRNEVNIELDHDPEAENGAGMLTVYDDGGGIPQSDFEAIFSLAESIQEAEDSIGWAGIGLKRAAVALAHTLVVKTRYEYMDQGAIIEIDIDEWLAEEDKDTYSITWVDDLQTHDDFDPDKGTTTIELRNLKFPFKEEMNPEDEDDDDEDGTQPLDEYLADTYDLYLSDSLPEARDATVNLSINDEPVEPDADIPFSFSPIDGVYPRTYPNLLLKPDAGNYEGDVLMDVTVGLLRSGDSEKSGLTLYANGRKILSHRTDKEAGFGISGGLNGFKASRGHKRLIIRADMRSLESAEDLPFNTSKTGINPDDYMAQEAYKKIKNAAQAYFDATFERFPAPLVGPYPPNSPHAGNQGEIKRYDYEQGRTRINGSHKPGKKDGRTYSYPEAQRLKDRAAIHAKLGIENHTAISDAHKPAYLGIHEPPSEESGKDGRLAHWLIDDDERVDHWFYTDELAYIDEGIDGQLEKHFLQYYEDDFPGLTIVSEGPEDTFDVSDTDELEKNVDEAISDLEALAATSARHGRILEDGVLAEWKYPKYRSLLREAHGQDLTDLEPVSSRDELTPEPEGGGEDNSTSNDADGAGDGSNTGQQAAGMTPESEQPEPNPEAGDSGTTDPETPIPDTAGESPSPTDGADGTTAELSFLDFCRQNRDVLVDIDEETLEDNPDEALELVLGQLKDGQTFREIRTVER